MCSVTRPAEQRLSIQPTLEEELTNLGEGMKQSAEFFCTFLHLNLLPAGANQ